MEKKNAALKELATLREEHDKLKLEHEQFKLEHDKHEQLKLEHEQLIQTLVLIVLAIWIWCVFYALKINP